MDEKQREDTRETRGEEWGWGNRAESEGEGDVTACLRYLAVSLDFFSDNHNDQLRHPSKCAHVCTVPAANPQRLVVRMF